MCPLETEREREKRRAPPGHGHGAVLLRSPSCWELSAHTCLACLLSPGSGSQTVVSHAASGSLHPGSRASAAMCLKSNIPPPPPPGQRVFTLAAPGSLCYPSPINTFTNEGLFSLTTCKRVLPVPLSPCRREEAVECPSLLFRLGDSGGAGSRRDPDQPQRASSSSPGPPGRELFQEAHRSVYTGRRELGKEHGAPLSPYSQPWWLSSFPGFPSCRRAGCGGGWAGSSSPTGSRTPQLDPQLQGWSHLPARKPACPAGQHNRKGRRGPRPRLSPQEFTSHRHL